MSQSIDIVFYFNILRWDDVDFYPSTSGIVQVTTDFQYYNYAGTSIMPIPSWSGSLGTSILLGGTTVWYYDMPIPSVYSKLATSLNTSYLYTLKVMNSTYYNTYRCIGTVTLCFSTV